MKTLAELNDLLADLPTPFAAEAEPAVGDFPLSDIGADSESDSESYSELDFAQVTYEKGVPQAFTGDSPSLMPLDDFNRLGNLATRELFFRRCGGIHTFSHPFSDENNGYAKGALLHLDVSLADNKIFKAVESQEQNNDLDFASDPSVIDARTLKPSDPEGATPRVLWKSADRVYGLAEGLVHFSVDYSRRQDVSSGDALEEDSLVLLGSNAWEFGIWGTDAELQRVAGLLPVFVGGTVAKWEKALSKMRAISTCGDFQVKVQFGDSAPLYFPCKSMQGGSAGFDSVGATYLGSARIVYNRFMGGASFPLGFFAKKGTKVSYFALGNSKYSELPGGNEIANAVSCIAFPFETVIEGGVA